MLPESSKQLLCLTFQQSQSFLYLYHAVTPFQYLNNNTQTSLQSYISQQ